MAERKLIIQPITREPKTGKWFTDFPEVAKFILKQIIDLSASFFDYSCKEEMLSTFDDFINTFFARYIQNGWPKKVAHIEERLQDNQCNPDDLLYALDCRKMEFSDLWYVAVCAKDFVDGMEYIDYPILDMTDEVRKYREQVVAEVEKHDAQTSYTMTIMRQTKVDGKVKKETIYSSSSKSLLEIIGRALYNAEKSPEFRLLTQILDPGDPTLQPLDQSNKNHLFQKLLEGYIEGNPLDREAHRNLEANKRRKVQADATSIMARMAYLVGFTDDVVYWKEGGKAWDRARKIKASQKKMPEYMRNSAYDMP